MVPARPQSEELTVQHVGKPRKWMETIRGGERPANTLQRESRPNMGVLHHIFIVVQTGEFKRAYLPENGERDDDET